MLQKYFRFLVNNNIIVNSIYYYFNHKQTVEIVKADLKHLTNQTYPEYRNELSLKLKTLFGPDFKLPVHKKKAFSLIMESIDITEVQFEHYRNQVKKFARVTNFLKKIGAQK